jgi:hypothetical protein
MKHGDFCPHAGTCVHRLFTSGAFFRHHIFGARNLLASCPGLPKQGVGTGWGAEEGTAKAVASQLKQKPVLTFCLRIFLLDTSEMMVLSFVAHCRA